MFSKYQNIFCEYIRISSINSFEKDSYSELFIFAIILDIILLHNSILLSFGYYETCDINYQLAPEETAIVNFTYKPHTSCRYFIKASSGYEIVLSCELSIPRAYNGDCNTDRFLIATDGNKTLLNAEFFCGRGMVTRASLFNYLSYGITIIMR